MKNPRRDVRFNASNLKKVEQDGIPAKTLVRVLDSIANRGSQPMTRATKEKLLDKRDKAKSLAVRIGKLGREAREFAEGDPFLGIQPVVYEWDNKSAVLSRSWKFSYASPIGRSLEGMEFLAKSMRETSLGFGKYLRANRQADRGVAFILGWILWCNEDFQCWKPLSDLLAAAFRADGKDAAHKSVKLSAGALRKAAERILRRRSLLRSE